LEPGNLLQVIHAEASHVICESFETNKIFKGRRRPSLLVVF